MTSLQEIGNQIAEIPSVTRIEEDTTNTATSRVYRELEEYRRSQNEEAAEQLLTSLSTWMQNESSTLQEDVDAKIPNQWRTELMTSYLEMMISRGMTEDKVVEIIETHWSVVHHPRIFFISNQHKLKSVVKLFLDRYKSLSVDNDTLHSSLDLQKTENHNEHIRQHINANNPKAALKLLQKTNNLILTMNHLGSLLEKLPLQVIDYCIFQYPSILPWNVLDALHYDPSSFKTLSSVPSLETLSLYLSKLFKYHTECLHDTTLLHLYIECNLIDGAPSKEDNAHYISSQGLVPKKNAHTVKWKHKEELLKMVRDKKTYPYDDIQVVVLFEKYAFFPGLVVLYLSSNQSRKALDIILSMDDLVSFKELMSQHYDRYDWGHVLSIKTKYLTENEGKDEAEIMVDVIFSLLISCLGSQGALSILEKHESFMQHMSPESFEMMIRVATLESKTAEVSMELLEHINTYFWSPRTSVLPPQFRSAVDKELHRKHAIIDYHPPTIRFYEEASPHWGTSITATQCPLCSIPILQYSSPIMVRLYSHYKSYLKSRRCSLVDMHIMNPAFNQGILARCASHRISTLYWIDIAGYIFEVAMCR